MLDDFQGLGLTVEPFRLKDGEVARRLWAKTKEYGLSLGDPLRGGIAERACLSLGLRLEAAVLTSDRA